MSSLAQEESRSISENCTWGQRKRFADGKVSVPYGQFLGYDRAEDGGLKLNEDEAVIVRRIYKMYMEGATPHRIAKFLTAEGIPTPGKKHKWSQNTVESILTNEKYKGDALLQKSYTTDYLTKKKKINEGEMPQYYVENSHEAIIEPAVFDMVQLEVARRKASNSRHSGIGLFASKIKCGECGSWYGAKVWHSTSKYRRTIYQCNGKFRNTVKCRTPHYTEDEIKALFVATANALLTEKQGIIASFKEMRMEVFDTAALEAEGAAIRGEIALVSDAMHKAINENARIAQDQSAYSLRYAELVKRYEDSKTKHDAIAERIADKQTHRKKLDAFIAALAKQDGLLAEFDERLWHGLVEHMTAHEGGEPKFTFKG